MNTKTQLAIIDGDPRVRVCPNCKTEHPLTIDFWNRRGDGFQGFCRVCDRAKSQQTKTRMNRENPISALGLQKYRKTPKGRFSQYKTGARIRAKEWGLSLEQFSAFWKQPCSYCGGGISTIGLDCVDPKIGYIQENIVPCCAKCNRAKHSMTLEEFKNQIRLIYETLFGN